MGRLRSLRKGYCDDPNFLHETVERVVQQPLEARMVEQNLDYNAHKAKTRRARENDGYW